MRKNLARELATRCARAMKQAEKEGEKLDSKTRSPRHFLSPNAVEKLVKRLRKDHPGLRPSCHCHDKRRATAIA